MLPAEQTVTSAVPQVKPVAHDASETAVGASRQSWNECQHVNQQCPAHPDPSDMAPPALVSPKDPDTPVPLREAEDENYKPISVDPEEALSTCVAATGSAEPLHLRCDCCEMPSENPRGCLGRFC